MVTGVHSNSNYLIETIEFADNNDFNVDNLGSFIPKFKIINANPMTIKAKTFKKLKNDVSNHSETDYWLLQSLVASYKTLVNQNQSNSDWNVEIFRECLYLFDFENFTFADLNEILTIPLKSCTDLYVVMFPFHIDVILPKSNDDFTQSSFNRVTIQLREDEISRVLSTKCCHVFQSKMNENVIDLRETSLNVELIDDFVNDDFTCLSKFRSFINEINDEDLQKKAFAFHLQKDNEFTIIEFEELVSLAESINYEDQSILSTVQLTSSESINLLDFDRLINISIKLNDDSLLNFAISSFEFNVKPKVVNTPKIYY
ncbi:hypothetical protein P9112_008102 [Eukaryota sp. TZLM1-RC]